MEYPIGAHGAVAQCALSPKHIGERTGVQSAPRTFRSRFRDCCREREGSQLVEFALIAPLLFVLILGIVWLGIALNNYIVLTDAVSAGARAIALARNEDSITGGDPCAYAVQVANSDAASLNQNSITYRITYTPIGSTTSTIYTNSCTALGGDAMNSQDSVAMQATYPAVIPLVSQQGIFVWTRPGTLNLIAHTTQLVQ